MAISKKTRELVKQKFGGLCAYSGTPLEDDWQVDHLKPLIRNNRQFSHRGNDDIDNLMPTQRRINWYKRCNSLEGFRSLMKTLHLRLKKLPKNPTTEQTIKRKEFMLKLAGYFDITPDKPFSGVFYYERVQSFERSGH